MATRGGAAVAARVRRLREALAREKAKSAALAKERVEAREQQAAAAEILKVISRSPDDAQPVFDAIVRRALRIMQGHSAIVTRIADGLIHLAALTSTSNAGDAVLRKFYPRPISHSTHAQAVQTRRPTTVVDTEKVPRSRAGSKDLARARGYRSMVVVPMLLDRTAIGTISVTRKEPGPFTRHQVELLETFAEQAVIAIENVRRFNETKEALERQTATAEILRAIASSPTDVQPVFDAIGASAIRLLGGHSFSISRIEGGMLHLSSFSTVNEAGDEMLKTSFPFRISHNPVVADAIRTKTALYVADTELDPRVGGLLRDVARARGYRSMLHAPMVREERVVGLIHVTRAEAGAFTDHHLQLIKTFADQAVIAIENVRLFNETKEALERQTAISEILRVISASPSDVTPVLDAVASRAARICDASDARIWLVEASSLRHVAGFGNVPMPVDLGKTMPLDRGTVTGRAVLDRATLHIEDTLALPQEEFPQGRALHSRSGARTFLVVPLMREEQALGAIMLRRTEVRPFNDKQVELLKTFADQAAIAIENVRLLNETREALERQTATAEILRVIASSPSDVQPVFDTIASSAQRLIGGISAIVTRVEGDLLHLAAFTATDQAMVDATRGYYPVPATRGFAGEAIRTAAPVCVEDVETDTRAHSTTRELWRMRGQRSAVLAPMSRRGSVIGLIHVLRAEPGVFSDHQIKMLQTFADQAVIAIENVRLFNETKEALERQTATAEVLKVIASSPADVQPVFDAVARNAVKLCDGLYANVFRFDGELLHWVGRAGSNPGPALARKYPMRPDASQLSGRVVHSGSVLCIEDTRADPEYDRDTAASAAAARRMVGTPMLREGKPIGAIVVGWAEPGKVPKVQQDLLKTFADQAVIAIENVRLFNETKEALERQTATAEVLRVISNSPTDTQPVFEAIAQSGLRLFPGAAVAVALPAGDLVRAAAIATEDPAVAAAWRARFPVPLARDQMHGAAILDRSLIDVPDADAAVDGPMGSGVRNFLASGNKAITIVPMVRGESAIGAISVIRLVPGPLKPSQIALLRTFADQAVIAIENVRLFNETKEALERQTATAEILKVIASSPSDVQPVFDAISQSARRLLGGYSASVARVDGDFVDLAAVSSDSEEGNEVLRQLYPRPIRSQSGTLERAILTGRPSAVLDTESDPQLTPEFREMARARGLRAAIGVPMMLAGAAVGAITVTRKEPGSFSDHQVGLLQTFADQAVIAIENVRLFNETKEALERQTATSEILRVISSSPTDTRPVFDVIARSGLRLFGGLNVAILLRREREFVLAGFSGPGVEELPDQVRTAPLDPERNFPSRAILEGKVLHITDWEGEEVPEHEKVVAKSFGIKSGLMVPLLRQDRGIGAIAVMRTVAGRFQDKDVALLQSFADQAVIAIENVRLFNETKEALERQTATAEILKVISSSPTVVQPVFDAIVESATRLFGRSARIRLLEGNELHLRASSGPAGGAMPGAPLPVTRDNIGGKAILDKVAAQIADTQAPGVPPGNVARGYRAIAVAPLLREGNALGAIAVTSLEPGALSDKQMALLQTFADQAVIAIENVRLFKELEARTAALSRSVGQLTALGEVGQAVSSTLELETVLKTIATHAVRLTGLDGASIYEYDEADEAFRLQAADNMAPGLLQAVRNTPIRKGDGTVGGVAITLQPIQVPDILDKGYQSTRKEVLVEAGYRAVLTVPLLREDHIIGALSVTRKTAGPFGDEIVELLKTFATQSAMAIQNARLFREIAEKGKQLEVASHHKSQFLASMSHELRTPLNALLGFNEMILGDVYGAVPADMQPPLVQMQTSGKHLLRLINNVLDLAKIEAGRMELALSDYSVLDTVEAVRSTLRPLAAEKGIELLASVPADVPLAYGDPGRITQCLMNLAGNSLKFTKVGKVEISVAENGKTLTYRVADTGIGIPPDKMESLFTEFKQTDATIASEYGGTGLGLSISKKFVEMHGGRIWVESTPGQGSTFSFEIPLRAGEGKSA